MGITAQVGFGPQDTDPRYAAGWTFVPAGFQGQVGNEDELVATLVAPAAGAYRYVYRFSPDGQRRTYCDPDGEGSGAALDFGPDALPTMTIAP